MPDEFPTFDVVALIGVVAAFAGMLQLRRGLGEIPKLSSDVQAALRAGDLARARALCGHAEGAAFARIGSALIDALGREPRPTAKALESVLAGARKRANAAAQRGRARDLVVAAVLIGAGAYAIRASLGVGSAFYAMIAAALVVTALGPILRRSMLDRLVRASDGLLQAAVDYLAHASAPDAICPECRSRDAARLGAPALDGLRDLGITELIVCKSCGFVRGRVERPEAILEDDARGVHLTPLAPPLESSAEPESEHEG
ncbi:MAG TPA: hypothetical protein VMI54_28780 [Polyangiaceae bacterium]|nr:hypothetical protein [Polyangiaceae bacterium]